MPKNFQAQKGWGQEEVGFRMETGLQEASPLCSKVPSENLATIERGRAHYPAALRPLLTPSNLSQPPSSGVNNVPFAHVVQLQLSSHRAQGVSSLLLGWAEVGGRGGALRSLLGAGQAYPSLASYGTRACQHLPGSLIVRTICAGSCRLYNSTRSPV